MNNEMPTPEPLSDWFRRIGTKLNRDDYEDGIAALHTNGERIEKLTESNRRLANQIVGYGDRIQATIRTVQGDAWDLGKSTTVEYLLGPESVEPANPYRAT